MGIHKWKIQKMFFSFFIIKHYKILKSCNFHFKHFFLFLSFDDIRFEKKKPIFFEEMFDPLNENGHIKKYVSFIFVWRITY